MQRKNNQYKKHNARKHTHQDALAIDTLMEIVTGIKLEKDEKINSLMRSIDNTNHRYGRSTLSVASAGVHKKWNMRRQYSSKIDTADFYCLPTIRA